MYYQSSNRSSRGKSMMVPNVPLLSYAESIFSLLDAVWNPFFRGDGRSPHVKSLVAPNFNFKRRDRNAIYNVAVPSLTMNKIQSLGYDLLKSLEFFSGSEVRSGRFPHFKKEPAIRAMEFPFLEMDSFLCDLLNSTTHLKVSSQNCKHTAQSSVSSNKLRSGFSPTSVMCPIYFPVIRTSTRTKTKMQQQSVTSSEKVETAAAVYVDLKPLNSITVESDLASGCDIVTSVSDKSEKPYNNSVDVMNREMRNRKSHKLSKLSKKRRRRQKKRNTETCNSITKIVLCESSSSNCAETDFTDSSDTACRSSNMTTKCKFQLQGLNCESRKVPESPRISNNDVISAKYNSDPSRTHCSSSSVSYILEQFVESESDDDWDFDISASIAMTESDIEFPNLMSGLFLHVTTMSPIVSDGGNCIDLFEVNNMSPELREINDRWRKMMIDIDFHEKHPTKVSFAQDESLTTVFPVEKYDRRGEWEIYALERFRFKRRIDELESIIAPCLTPSHREKILQRQNNATKSL